MEPGAREKYALIAFCSNKNMCYEDKIHRLYWRRKNY